MQQLLNPKWIDSGKCVCPEGKAYMDVRDTKPEAKGLILRVSPTGRKSWYFEWTVARKKRQVSMDGKTWPTTTIDAARNWAQEQRAVVEDGKDPRDAPAPTGDITISQLFDLRFKNVLALDHENYHKNCLEQQRVFDTDVLPLVGKVLVKDFKTAHLNMVIQPIIDRGSVTQSRRVFEMVRALINYGVEKDYIPFSPIAKAKPTGKEKRAERCLSLAELKQVWTTVEDVIERSSNVALIVKIALATSKRSQEIRGCDYELEIDEKKMLWTIPLDRIKGEVGATEDELVPLSPLALSLFKEAKRRTNGRLLFPDEKGDLPVTASVISRCIKRAQPRFGLKDAKNRPTTFKLKDLRSTVGTHMLNDELDLGITHFAKYLAMNHLSAIRSNVSDKHYDQNKYLKTKRDAMNKWATFLEKLIAGEIATGEEAAEMQEAA